MSTTANTRTATALAARRRDSQAALDRVHTAIAHLRRQRDPISAAAIVRYARVSRTYLYTNPDARTALESAKSEAAPHHTTDITSEDSKEATWRERTHNAEFALKSATTEITTQRERIGELLGRIRDLETEWAEDSIQRITTENTNLKQRVRQLTSDNRGLEERLKAARSNLRFHERRTADLEAQLVEQRMAR
ncbi:DUF6262 family protein [Nocardia fluminea]|uniref:DUF6262 family protein n=1 Tax=Nocardia fluminea TaxID=134984 RepID=UPI003D12BFDD